MQVVRPHALTAFVCGILFATGAMAQTLNFIPYSESFTSYGDGTSLENGLNGWYAVTNALSGAARTATVQSSPTNLSTKVAMIDIAVTLSNIFQTVDVGNPTNVWLNMDVFPVFYSDTNSGASTTPIVDEDATSIFYLNSNGYFVVYDGASSTWFTVTQTVGGATLPPQTTSTWVRVDILQDRAAKSWSLIANYTLLRQNIGFVKTNGAVFAGFDFINGSGGTSYVDKVSVDTTAPADLASRGGDWKPNLTISSNSASVDVLQGTDAVSSVMFTLWNTNINANGSTNSMLYTLASGASWMTPNTSSSTYVGGSQDAVTLSLSKLSLTAQSTPYTGVVTVAARDTIFGFAATNSPRYFNVSMRVRSVPSLTTTPASLTNTTDAGVPAAAQTFVLRNPSALYGVNYTIAVPVGAQGWLSVSPSSGTLAAGDSTVITATYTSAGAPVGTSQDSLVLSATDQATGMSAAGSLSTFPVTLIVRPQQLAASVYMLSNSVVQGHTASGQSFAISNASAFYTLDYTVAASSQGGNWLRVSPASGSMTGGVPNTISVSYDSSALPIGVVTGLVTITGRDHVTGTPAINSPKVIPVTLTVLPKAVLAADAQGSYANTVRLGHSPGDVTFRLWNNSATPKGALRYTVAVDGSPAWLTATPASGTVTGDTATITLHYDMLAQGRGSRQTMVRISGFDVAATDAAVDSPVQVSVSVSVMGGAKLDFSGSGAADIAVYNEGLGLWYFRNLVSGSQYSDRLGGWGYASAAGDYNGDGRVELGVYSAAASQYKTKQLSVDAVTIVSFGGSANYIPASGDFDGDGKQDYALYETQSGYWTMMLSSDSRILSGGFGGQNYTAIPNDYDGDGKTDVAVYDTQSGSWYVLLSSSGALAELQGFGGPAFRPVPGDFDGDSRADVAVYNESTGQWGLLLSLYNYAFVTGVFGGPGYTAKSGDYNGDGLDELALYYENDGTWYMVNINRVIVAWGLSWGGPGFKPVSQ